MKNLLLHYYGITTNYLYKKNTKSYFKYDGNTYIIEQIHNDYDIRILELLDSNNNYYKIVRNIYGSFITKVSGFNYVLLKKKNNENNVYNSIINNLRKPINNMYNNRLEWTKLWTEKIDYYEYLIQYINNYRAINESFHYYIGMGETAISYVKYNFIDKEEMLVLSHKRINSEDYFNPTNIIVDYRARDIAEFLKISFFNGTYKKLNLIKIINATNFSRNEYILLYGRLLFPNFYFDICDQIINNQQKEEKLSTIVLSASEYEQFLKRVYEIINDKIKIPKINWI